MARRSALLRSLIVAGLLATVVSCKRKPADVPDLAPEDAATVPPASRCAPLGSAPFVLGDPGTRGVKALGVAGADAGAASDTSADPLLPFASEVGEGVTWTGGFALGALRQGSAGLEHVVITLDANGEHGRAISLGPARGEAEPPRVAARGDELMAGVLDPELHGRALRLAKIRDGVISWGGTVHERSGESQAFDIGVGEHKSIVVWDEDGPELSTIQVVTFDTANANALTPPRSASPAGVDAESPRLVPRAGGFWLTYIARRAGEEDSDARDLAEDIGYRWIEAVPLDVNGSPMGPGHRVSSRDGHVLVFDVTSAADDGLLVVWRDDDTPSGSAGGAVMRALVRGANLEPPSVLVSNDVGAGVPTIGGGWLAVLDAADTTRLAPLSEIGELRAPLAPEPDVGSGEPIAFGASGILVARPAGRAVALRVLRCAAP